MSLHWDMKWASDLVGILKDVVLRSIDNPSWAVGVGVFGLAAIFLWKRSKQ